MPVLAHPATRQTGHAALFPPALSLYLDAWRLLAALAVMLCHFGSRRMSGGALWQLTPYGAEAVDVFFVLSGYVIAHAATREDTPRRFAVSRLARLWSVAIPALAVTFTLDAIGRLLTPAAYAALPGAPGQHALLWQGAAGLLFFNQLWSVAIPIGANIPWWSLGYEAPYYLAFGLARFGGSVLRCAGPLLVAAAAGPSIAILSLPWIAGAAIRRRHAAGGLPPWPVAVAPLPIWLLYEAACHAFGRPLGLLPHLRAETLQDLLVGLLFAAHLLGAPALLLRLPPCPAPLARAIRFGAGRSFALYLMHYPIMLFLRAAMLRAAPALSPFWLLPATLLLCAALAEVTERRKEVWRRWMEKGWGECAIPPRPPVVT